MPRMTRIVLVQARSLNTQDDYVMCLFDGRQVQLVRQPGGTYSNTDLNIVFKWDSKGVPYLSWSIESAHGKEILRGNILPSDSGKTHTYKPRRLMGTATFYFN